MLNKIHFVLFLILFIAQGCSDTKPFLRATREGDPVQEGDPNRRPNHNDVLTFYALGDWGTGQANQRAVAQALIKNVTEIPNGRNQAPFVLGLGDNVYEIGLPEGWNNPETIKMLHKTFGDVYKNVSYEGKKLVFHIIPGNHDYAGFAGGQYGWGDVIHQETTAEKIYSPFWKYYPIDPDKNSDTNDSTNYHALKNENVFSLTLPEKINLESNEKATIVAIDTQVLLNLYQNNDSTLIQQHWQRLNTLMEPGVSWKIIIGHHPVKAHGRHAGFRSAVWWLPIPPIILYTIVDKLFIRPLQDLDNPAYKKFRKDLIRIMNKHNVNLYLSGHEHSLQFLEIDENHFQIISGSAGKLAETTHKNDTIFSHAAFGFARFDMTDDELWVEFFQATTENGGYKTTALFKISK